MQVVRLIIGLDFDLAFAIIHSFGMSASQAYVAAASQLAEVGDSSGLQKLLSNIQGTSTDQEFDQVSLLLGCCHGLPQSRQL